MAAYASDTGEELHVLQSGVHEPDDREHAEHEHGGQHGRDERREYLWGLCRESHRDKRARKRKEVERAACGRL